MIAVRRVKEGVVMIELHLLPVSKPQTGEYPIGRQSAGEDDTLRHATGAAVAWGHKRTKRHLRAMSALPPKADKQQRSRDVRFVPKADIRIAADLFDHLRRRVRARRLRCSNSAPWRLSP